MTKPILYMGDDSLDRAAGYLGGVLAQAGLDFDYAPSAELVDDGALDPNRALYIISDFPVKNFRPGQMERIVEAVGQGTGLLMIGGWESFRGADGNYAGTPVAEALCVTLAEADDRVNWPYPCLMDRCADHPILKGLPFDRPAGVGGYNRVAAKPDSQVVLGARRFIPRREGDGYRFEPQEPIDPLLVVGQFGQGRSVAFTSDVAPHWVGGLVDWGPDRIRAAAPGGQEVEVGNGYACFLAQMVRWAGNL